MFTNIFQNHNRSKTEQAPGPNFSGPCVSLSIWFSCCHSNHLYGGDHLCGGNIYLYYMYNAALKHRPYRNPVLYPSLASIPPRYINVITFLVFSSNVKNITAPQSKQRLHSAVVLTHRAKRKNDKGKGGEQIGTGMCCFKKYERSGNT